MQPRARLGYAAGMSSLNRPPLEFERLHLATVTVDPRALLRLTGDDARQYVAFRRSAEYRFDAPGGEFGVCYAAFELTTAFVETVLRDAPQRAKPGERVLLDYAELASRRVINLKSGVDPRPLRLIKLYDEGLAAAKTDNRISSADDYAITQQWSKAFHDHAFGADGIVYLSRYVGSQRSVVLFERCASAIEIASVTPLLEHPDLATILDVFELGIERQ